MADPKIVESPEEVLSTLTKDGNRKWLYPTVSRGPWWRRRLVLAWGLIAFFVLLPIVQIGGKPAVLLDVAAREFTFFGYTFFATDMILLMLFGIGSLFFVVAFTALFGRVWCGWACPQTVYLEFLYRPIETLFEGPPNKRRRRDEKKDDGYWVRKIGKWTAFTVVSILLAHVFVSYFAGWDDLLGYMSSPPSENLGYFGFMSFVSGLVLFDFGIFREQMCTITCPYARIQSVLLDRDSLIVSYDERRGEPRGKLNSAEGDCIDCGACVRTCPTGIDIRKGLQMECVNCTQCIDACDEIMIKVDRPVGLIRYTSDNKLENKPRKFRARFVIYVVALFAVVAAATFILIGRTPVDVNILRVTGMPYVQDGEGDVLNSVRFRLQNRTPDVLKLQIKADEGVEIAVVGSPIVTIKPKETKRVQARIKAPLTTFSNGERDVNFRLFDSEADVEVQKSFQLVGPK